MVLLAFFILAIQLFITLIEFKLTTLVGFVLIPFGLFGKTAFLAERVLGNVVSSGVKVLVLAVIIGIGSTLFAEFTAGFGGEQPTVEDAMAIVLAALSLLGLGIFGPAIANGLISGGPQLGAGAAIGTGVAAAGVTAAAAAGTGFAGAAGARGVAAAARGGAATAGGAAAAYSLGSAGKSGAASVSGGLGGVARAGAGVATSPLRRAAGALRESAASGARTAIAATGGTVRGGGSDPGAAAPSSGPPAWARQMRRAQSVHQGTTAAVHAVRSGDGHASGSSITLSESDR